MMSLILRFGTLVSTRSTAKIMRMLLIIALISNFSAITPGQAKLRLSIDFRDKTVCLQDSVEIVATLKNLGRRPIAIDPNRIGSVSVFDRFVGTRNGGSGSFGSVQGPPTDYIPKFIVLPPNRSYILNKTFVFDRRRFSKTGEYRMKVGYEQPTAIMYDRVRVWSGLVYSNTKPIIVKDCSSPN